MTETLRDPIQLHPGVMFECQLYGMHEPGNRSAHIGVVRDLPLKTKDQALNLCSAIARR